MSEPAAQSAPTTIELILTVRDAVGSPIEGALVRVHHVGAALPPTKDGVETDPEGRATISLIAGQAIHVEVLLDSSTLPLNFVEERVYVAGKPDNLVRATAGNYIPTEVPVYSDGTSSYATVFFDVQAYKPKYRFHWQNPLMRTAIYGNKRETSLRTALKILFNVDVPQKTGHDELVAALSVRFDADRNAATQTYPDWLYYLIFHFSGMRYDNAHWSYAKPAWLVRRLRFQEIERKFGYDLAKLSSTRFDPLDKAHPPDPTAAFPKDHGEAYALVDLLLPLEQDKERKAVLKLLADGKTGRACAFLQKMLCVRLCGDGSIVYARNRWKPLVKDDFGALGVLQLRYALNRMPQEVWAWIRRLTEAHKDIDDGFWEKPKTPPAGLPTNLYGINWQTAIGDWYAHDAGTWWRSEHQRSLEPIVTRAVCDQIASMGEHARGVSITGGLTGNAEYVSSRQPLRFLDAAAAKSNIEVGTHLFYLEWYATSNWNVDAIYNVIFRGSETALNKPDMHIDVDAYVSVLGSRTTVSTASVKVEDMPVCFPFVSGSGDIGIETTKLQNLKSPFDPVGLQTPPDHSSWLTYLLTRTDLWQPLPNDCCLLVPLIARDTKPKHRWGQRHMIVKKRDNALYVLYIYHEALVAAVKGGGTFYSFQTAGAGAGGVSVTGIATHNANDYPKDRLILYGRARQEEPGIRHSLLSNYLPDKNGHFPEPSPPPTQTGNGNLTLLVQKREGSP